MSNKLFYKSSDRLYISSYRKSNIRAIAEHCIQDTRKLTKYLHKIAQLRFYVFKYVLLHILFCKPLCSKPMHDINILFFIYLFRTFNNTSISISFFTFYIFHFVSVTNVSIFLYEIYGLCIGYYAFCIELCKFALFYKKGLSSLPTQISKYTLLRSPHTDKKSREQFEKRTHKKVYVFPSIFADYYSFLCDGHYVYLLCTLVHERHILCHE